MSKAKLFVVSAPSGCGKGTILSRVFKDREVYYSVSCTTRKPRAGEEDGVNYFFVGKEKFEDMIHNGEFLEYASFVENSYGTPAAPVKEKLAAGIDVVLEIETNGAFQVKKAMPEAVLIFILPPSVKEIRRRLNKRGTEDEATINKRTNEAADEIRKAFDYDYVVMNDALEDAVNDFERVLDSAKNEDDSALCFRADNDNVKKMIQEVLKNA